MNPLSVFQDIPEEDLMQSLRKSLRELLKIAEWNAIKYPLRILLANLFGLP